MDVKKPDMQAILAKLSGIRNHMNMLVPILIALVSIVPFVLGSMVGGKLSDRVAKESLANARKLDTLSRSVVSEEEVEQEREFIKQYTADVNAVEKLIQQTTLRPLLSTAIFPEPSDTSRAIFEDFGELYVSAIETLVDSVNGRDCPSEEELGEHGTGMGGGGGGMDMEMMMMGYGGMGMEGAGGAGSTNKIVDAICTQRAKASSVYVSPLDMPGYEFWADFSYESRDQALINAWYWQLGYWIIEDVFETVKACNVASRNVLTAPVKRIKFLGFARPPSTNTMGGGMGGYGMEMMMMGGGGDTAVNTARPWYVIDPKDELLTPVTKRFSTEDFDVVHFGVSLIVDADQVSQVMKAVHSAKEHRFRGFANDQAEQIFKRNQMTILESRVTPVMQERGEHQLYRYGDGEVVELSLVVEYLFERSAYKTLEPQVVAAEIEGTDEDF